MNIQRISTGRLTSGDVWEVRYVVNGAVYSEKITEHMARMLERAKDAGREECKRELRKLLGVE